MFQVKERCRSCNLQKMLEENKMKKQFWKSKAVWGAIIVFIAGGLSALGYPVEWLYALGTALGIYGVRVALK